MNKRQGFVNLLVGILIGCVISTSVTVYAASDFQSIHVAFNKVNLSVNGQRIVADNILYNGTTYVPIRAVANAFGKNVGWNADTNTASINDKDYVESTTPTTTSNNNSVTSEYLGKDKIIIEGEGQEILTIIETNQTYYTPRHIVDLINNYGTFELDRNNDFLSTRTIRIMYFNKEQVLIDNIPYRIINDIPYVSKDFYEKSILPLVN